jgi:serine protease SohB
MDWLIDLQTFAAKILIATCALMIVAWFISRLVSQAKTPAGVRVKPLHEKLRGLSETVRRAVLTRRELKRATREQAKAKKDRRAPRPAVYVLDFAGDLAASAVQALRHEITSVIGVARTSDEVVLRLDSAGGLVHAYGFAASQLSRIKDKRLKLTVVVDKIAASGGYMMACVADEIIAAPFSIVGSIGVVSPVPNLHRFLAEHGIDYEEMTAGEFKRTVSFLGRISDEGKKKFQEQLEETHELFMKFVTDHRPHVAIDQVATGEYWFASRAKELNLVDRLMTSDDYLLSRMETANLFQITYKERRPLARRMAGLVSDEVDRLGLKWWSRLGTPGAPLA